MERYNVILAAGLPHTGRESTTITQVGLNDTAINWSLRSLGAAKNTYLITGYDADSVRARDFPGTLVVNSDWRETGSAYSLLSATEIFAGVLEGSVSELVVAYGDVLFRESVVAKLREETAPCSIVWDSSTVIGQMEKANKTYERVFVSSVGTQAIGHLPDCLANGFFVGVARFTGEALSLLANVATQQTSRFRKATLADLVEYIRAHGIEVSAVDARENWAQIGSERDIVRFVLGTKAETLARMRKIVSKCRIEDQVSFDVETWKKRGSDVVEMIRAKFSGQNVIVRSSARSEDSFTHSNAGAYTSLLNIDPNNGLELAIEEVIASYHNLQLNDQVLVQPMLSNVVRSGVVFTRTLEHGAPYYVINYDETGQTDGITAGNNNDHRTLVVRRDANDEQVARQELIPLLNALKEIESLLSFDSLDVEFAMTGKDTVHILQVRPITVHQGKTLLDIPDCGVLLSQAESRWQELQSPERHNVGKRPVFGVMPDWNPAEIIGTNPSKLAESLYKYLIMDETWATQRAEYGYRDVRPQPLLVSFAGKPYVDVRASFNSFLPRNLDNSEAAELADFYLEYLIAKPELHDKVEFEVIPTCVGPGFGLWEERLATEGRFAKELIEKVRLGLLEVTSYAVKATKQYLKNVEVLQARINQRRDSDVPIAASVRNVRMLLDECRLYGTLPFAHLARSGFVAATFLKEGVREQWLTKNAMDDFMASVRTVSHELTDDAKRTATGEFAWDAFVRRYGHLRPGTYDITSPAYFDDPEKFLRPIVESAMSASHIELSSGAWESEKSKFFENLRTLGLDFADTEFEQFLRDAIEGREKAKFIFTRNLSEALDMMRLLAKDYDLSVEEWSNLTLFDIFNLAESVLPKDEQVQFLKLEALKNAQQREASQLCELPALLTHINDFYSFELTAGVPNFIGSTRVMAKCIHLEGAEPGEISVKGAIVLIPQADPGYDWLFGQGIAGLITMYGGANSHMAIRAAEFGLPAAIGIGEQLFKQLSQAQELELDPANNVMRPLR
ncbi:MAG: hypothetical protein JJU10_07645 [Idiomarina sp.]|nr:hypothetical protein [Idiomarina sp.]